MSYPRGSTDDLFPRSPTSSFPNLPVTPTPSTSLTLDQQAKADPSTARLSKLSNASLALSKNMQWIMVGFFLVFLGYLVYLQTRSDVTTNGMLRGISDIFVMLGSVACALACGYAAWNLRSMRKATPGIMMKYAWLGWLLLGGAATAYSIGQGIWTWYDANYASANLPFPAAYDPFYLLVYPLSWVGIALLIPRSGTIVGRTRLLLDAGIAVASVLAVSWYFILGPTIMTLSGPALTKVVALAYPLGDLSLCVAAALLLFGPSGATALSASIGRLAIGVTWLAVTDSLYGYGQLQGTYHTGLIQDIGWPMSWLFVGLAALVFPVSIGRLATQPLSTQQVTHSSRLTTVSAALRAVTPMVLALVTCALLILEVALRNNVPLMQIVLVCAGLFLLPVIRQLLTLIDNLILNERLKIALEQSQRAFQQSQQELLATSTRAEQYDELRAGIQNLQTVTSMLAKGDLKVRANVQGPLSPVAMSLNLLIERMNRWSQLIQVNQVLEGEASQLRRVLEELSEGRLSNTLSANHSAQPTGSALLATMRLQNRLQTRFARLRETTELVGRHWRSTSENIRRVRKTFQGSTLDPYYVDEVLLQLEKRVVADEALLQELWIQASAYVPANEANGGLTGFSGEPGRTREL